MFNVRLCLLLFLVITSWTIISIKFGNMSTTQVLMANSFVYIAYILYLVKFIQYHQHKTS
ncbi:hypothetical protein CD134_06315 [Staphylococcus lutrae]|uniref:Uncharacterized protein n=1 Tax=Staphylococcus lutrae TaxID=155085 RepID=A0AAC9RVL2_9STAP|nr:hypothetical protein B5P37_11645 [Staphylococcus lutrae]PNZ37388.1 hypothetical protein CD134_06315 [Staphylococcus lutrae]